MQSGQFIPQHSQVRARKPNAPDDSRVEDWSQVPIAATGAQDGNPFPRPSFYGPQPPPTTVNMSGADDLRSNGQEFLYKEKPISAASTAPLGSPMVANAFPRSPSNLCNYLTVLLLLLLLVALCFLGYHQTTHQVTHSHSHSAAIQSVRDTLARQESMLSGLSASLETMRDSVQTLIKQISTTTTTTTAAGQSRVAKDAAAAAQLKRVQEAEDANGLLRTELEAIQLESTELRKENQRLKKRVKERKAAESQVAGKRQKPEERFEELVAMMNPTVPQDQQQLNTLDEILHRALSGTIGKIDGKRKTDHHTDPISERRTAEVKSKKRTAEAKDKKRTAETISKKRQSAKEGQRADAAQKNPEESKEFFNVLKNLMKQPSKKRRDVEKEIQLEKQKLNNKRKKQRVQRETDDNPGNQQQFIDEEDVNSPAIDEQKPMDPHEQEPSLEDVHLHEMHQHNHQAQKPQQEQQVKENPITPPLLTSTTQDTKKQQVDDEQKIIKEEKHAEEPVHTQEQLKVQTEQKPNEEKHKKGEEKEKQKDQQLEQEEDTSSLDEIIKKPITTTSSEQKTPTTNPGGQTTTTPTPVSASTATAAPQNQDANKPEHNKQPEVFVIDGEKQHDNKQQQHGEETEQEEEAKVQRTQPKNPKRKKKAQNNEKFRKIAQRLSMGSDKEIAEILKDKKRGKDLDDFLTQVLGNKKGKETKTKKKK